jgi:phosphoglycerate dehydrogenase-like enzyme
VPGNPEEVQDGCAEKIELEACPHVGGQSDGARDRQWRLWRENVRRFVAGEPLLCVVDKQKGY